MQPTISITYDHSDFINKPVIVAFCGPIGVGKSTLAHELADSTGGKVMSFADPLRAMVSQIVGEGYLSSDMFDGVRGKDVEIPWLSGGMTGRKLLQLCGTEFGREMIDPNIWVKITENKLDNYVDTTVKPCKPHTHVFIDDLRFDNEAEMVRSMGGFVVEVKRDGAYNFGKDSHVSEKGVSPHLIHGDFIL
jgi:hypothetical protein